MALAPRRVDPLDILGRMARQQKQGGDRGPRAGVWNPQMDGAPQVEQGPFVGERPGLGQGLSAIDPVAAQGIVKLGLEDPDQFAMVMAATGAPPPVMPKAQDRLPSAQSTMPEPRSVQTETIRPEMLTPAQRITRGEGDAAGMMRQGNVEPGETAQQALGRLLSPQPDLIAAPAPEPVLGPMLEQERLRAPDVVAPPVPMDNFDMMNPTPFEQQQAQTTGAEGEAITGTSNPYLAALGQALMGVKAPEEPRVPPPMPAPAAPRPSQPIQPSATLMSLLLGSLGKNRQTPLRVGG